MQSLRRSELDEPGITGTLFDVAGPAQAPAIVFVHASGWTRSMWLPQMAALADLYRVIAPDLPGHGIQAKQRFTLDAAVASVARTIDDAGSGRALVVGLSLGGYVAMALARAHPERVAGLLLAGCSVGFRGRLGLLTRLSALLYTGVCREPVLAYLTNRQRLRLRRAYTREIAEPQLSAGIYLRPWGRALLELLRQDVRGMLRDYTGPVLILNGVDDTYNREEEDEHARAAGNAPIYTIQHAGHISNLDQPEAFTAAVRAFARAIGW